MRNNYLSEREGQYDFYKEYIFNNIVDAAEQKARIENLINNNTDGIYKGSIFEFKRQITNLDTVLSQVVIYLSRIRIKGRKLPGQILLVSLNDGSIYRYYSADFINDIQKIYFGPASQGILNFHTALTPDKIEFTNVRAIDNILQYDGFTKVDVNIDNIVGLANNYYTLTNGRKVDFSREIRFPNVLDYINPYTQPDNSEFKYVMDVLNDRIKKKQLGAFYTPSQYVVKSTELLRSAIESVPSGNDYIILDRCAGTGNLQRLLTDEELSHCILSTYEFIEWVELYNEYAGRVRYIVPPQKPDYRSNEVDSGLIVSADAMNSEFLENIEITRYINNPSCTIIVMENPPYSFFSANSESDDNDDRIVRQTNNIQTSYVKSKILEEGVNYGRDFGNLFIWSAFKYYLKKTGDSLICYSPIKYFKVYSLFEANFKSGFICNRKHFHASASAISCCWWRKEEQYDGAQSWELPVYDIVDGLLNKITTYTINKLFNYPSNLYIRADPAGLINGGFVCNTKGELSEWDPRAITSDEIIGYIRAKGCDFQQPRLNIHLFRIPLKGLDGCYLLKSNYLNLLPLFVAGKYPIEDNWFEQGAVYRSADQGNLFTNNQSFLDKCLIYASLSYFNKCLSFNDENGRFYQNEICFDYGTLASERLSHISLNRVEIELIQLWKDIRDLVRDTPEYNPGYKYGPYHIAKEIDTTRIDPMDPTNKIYNHPLLHGHLKVLQKKLKNYYISDIKPLMFQYQLLKI